MADYLPTSIKNLNTKLGEQLADGGGGGSSDFSVKSLTFVNGDSVYISPPNILIYSNMTVYDEDGQPVALGDTLFVAGNMEYDIAPSESITFNVVTYKNKILLSDLVSTYAIVGTSGCSVDGYYTGSDPETCRDVELITFTSDSASITIRRQR